MYRISPSFLIVSMNITLSLETLHNICSYSIHVIALKDGQVKIRDGSLSQCDRTKSLEGYQQLLLFPQFLSQYVDVKTEQGLKLSLISSLKPLFNIASATTTSTSPTHLSAPLSVPMPSISSIMASPIAGPASVPSRGSGVRAGVNVQPPPTPPSNPLTPHTPHSTSHLPITSPPPSNIAPSPALPTTPSHAPSPQPGRSRVNLSNLTSTTKSVHLTTSSLNTLCTPLTHYVSPDSSSHFLISPLEAHLAANMMRRYIDRTITNDTCPLITKQTQMSPTDSNLSSLMFRGETWQGRVTITPTHFTSLRLQVQSLPEHNDKWTPDEMNIMEKFFDARVCCPPYKCTAINAFFTLLGNMPHRVIRDFVHIMKLDLYPDPQHKWALRLCMTYPPYGPFIQSIHQGGPGIIVGLPTHNAKRMLFFVQLTRQDNMPWQNVASPAGIGSNPGSGTEQWIIPLVYDTGPDSVQIIPSPGLQIVQSQVNIMNTITNILKFINFRQGECQLYNTIRDLLTNPLTSSPSQPITPGTMGPQVNMRGGPGTPGSVGSAVMSPGTPGSGITLHNRPTY